MKKYVEGFPGYVLYSNGSVYSEKSNRFLKPFPISRKNKEGIKEYLAVKLCNKGVEKTFQIHRLIATAFIENPHNKEEVNHKNGIKSDNSVENLEWVTHGENVRHSFLTGLNSGEKWTGVLHSRATFTEDQVHFYCKKFQEGATVKQLTGSLDNEDSLKLYNKLYRIYKRDNWQSISKNYNW